MKITICIFSLLLYSLFVNAQVSHRGKKHKNVNELKTITPQLSITDTNIGLAIPKPAVAYEDICVYECVCTPGTVYVLDFGTIDDPFTIQELSEMGAKGISGPHVVPIRHGQPH